MRKNLAFILFLLPLIIQSQELIRGKVIISECFNKQFPLIEIKVKDFINKTVLDDFGYFQLKIEKPQQQYLLEFYLNDSIIKNYTYKHSFTKMKRPKTISMISNCSISRKKALLDWKNKAAKLYVYQDISLSKEDIKTQKKYRFSYIIITKNDVLNFDCYREYNRKILTNLVLAKKIELKKINKNTIGKDKFYTWVCK